MSAALATRVRWVAGRDGVAHCRAGTAVGDACGLPALSERFAWPATARCLRCQSVSSAVEQPAPVTNGNAPARDVDEPDAPTAFNEVM